MAQIWKKTTYLFLPGPGISNHNHSSTRRLNEVHGFLYNHIHHITRLSNVGHLRSNDLKILKTFLCYQCTLRLLQITGQNYCRFPGVQYKKSLRPLLDLDLHIYHHILKSSPSHYGIPNGFDLNDYIHNLIFQCQIHYSKIHDFPDTKW